MAAAAGHSMRKKGGRRPVVVALVCVIVLCLVVAAIAIWRIVGLSTQISSIETAEAPAVPEQGAELADNPVDFTALQEENPDVYAWIYVPGTEINHPVLQSAGDDSYYLTHDAKGDDNALGAVFSEAYNTKSFEDPVTILYGHNGVNDLMFSTLHRYQDAGFFNENRIAYVYTPGHVRTYRIVSAYTTDDTHIMYKYNQFLTADKLAQFEADLADPHSIDQNVDVDVELGADSRLLVLSTCNTGALEQYGRYIVVGVMEDDQQTR